MPNQYLLVVDRDPQNTAALRRSLSPIWTLIECSDMGAARAHLAATPVDAVAVNVSLAGAIDCLAELAAQRPEVARIALADTPDARLAEVAVNRGEVQRFYLKPWPDAELRATFARLASRHRRSGLPPMRIETEAQAAQNERLVALGQLAGGVAHEINNPLGAIVVFARTAARDLPPAHPAAADLLEIQKAARQAQKIVQSLLTFSRRTPPEERKPLDLAALVRQSQPLLQAVSKSPLDYSLEHVPSIEGNVSRLQQVLLNLVANADQAAAGRGRVHVRLFSEERDAVLEVSDDGPGIPGEILAHIFEPFFTTKPQGAGTGLGLAIAYGIVREHGGEISAENLAPTGSRFRVRLPLPAHEQQVA